MKASMSNGSTPLYTLLSSQALADVPVPPWRVKGIFPTQGLAAIYGPSTSGKSFLSLDLACSIALGNSWFGFTTRQCPVIYIALEGEGGFPKRIRAWAQYNCHPPPSQLNFIINEPFDITDQTHVSQLAAVIPKNCVVIIDTLNRSAPDKDENTSEGMGAILSGCKALQNLTQSLIILIHHTGKDESRGLRGHSSLLAAVDSCIEVRLDDDTRTWMVTKSKDDGAGIEFCFELSVESLEVDEEDEVITSCAIKSLTEVAVHKSGGLKFNQKSVLEALKAVLATKPLLTWEEALDQASGGLPHIDSKHRNSRARTSLNSLIKSRNLIFDPDTNLLTLPDGADTDE
jgi:putative DNA primase/helicase